MRTLGTGTKDEVLGKKSVNREGVSGTIMLCHFKRRLIGFPFLWKIQGLEPIEGESWKCQVWENPENGYLPKIKSTYPSFSSLIYIKNEKLSWILFFEALCIVFLEICIYIYIYFMYVYMYYTYINYRYIYDYRFYLFKFFCVDDYFQNLMIFAH